jgi:hypothetical protein
MSLTVKLTNDRAFTIFDGVGDDVMSAFAKGLRDIESRILSDARANAVSHFHSAGVDPGGYLKAFQGGVKEKKGSVVGYVRNAHPIAHLLEYGFTISDLMIVPGTGKNTKAQVGDLMKFAGSAGDVFRRTVPRPETAVRAFPALGPAFEAHRGEIIAAAEDAAASAVAKANK